MGAKIPLPSWLARLETVSLDEKTKGPGRYKEGIKFLFRRILSEVQPGEIFELDYRSEAERHLVSERTIRRWVAVYVRNHWILPLDRKGGRGKKATFRLYWGTQFIESPARSGKKTRTQKSFSKKEKHYAKASATLNGQKGYAYAFKKKTPKEKNHSATDRFFALKDYQYEEYMLGKIKLIKAAKLYRWAMADLRLTLNAKGAAARVVLETAGVLLDGVSIRVWNLLHHVFYTEGSKIVAQVQEVLEAEGLRAAFAVANRLLREALGILKPVPERRVQRPKAKLWPWDLRDFEERQAFIRLALDIAAAGGGTCPRCGKLITPELSDAPGYAFENDQLCKCIYIAAEKAYAGEGIPPVCCGQKMREIHIDCLSKLDNPAVSVEDCLKIEHIFRCEVCGREIHHRTERILEEALPHYMRQKLLEKRYRVKPGAGVRIGRLVRIGELLGAREDSGP